MKVAKIIPKTIPILILLREKRKIWCKIGQKTLYLVVLGGYAYTLGGVYYIHLTMEACYSVVIFAWVYKGCTKRCFVGFRHKIVVVFESILIGFQSILLDRPTT